MINSGSPGVRGQRREEVWFLIVDVLLNHYTGVLFREHEGFTLDVGLHSSHFSVLHSASYLTEHLSV